MSSPEATSQTGLSPGAVRYWPSLYPSLSTRLGLPSRLWLLALATLLATPLAAATLLLAPPPAMAALAAYYLFAETWFAILFTVIVEVVEPEIRATAIALFLFFMNQVMNFWSMWIIGNTHNESRLEETCRWSSAHCKRLWGTITGVLSLVSGA